MCIYIYIYTHIMLDFDFSRRMKTSGRPTPQGSGTSGPAEQSGLTPSPRSTRGPPKPCLIILFYWFMCLSLCLLLFMCVMFMFARGPQTRQPGWLAVRPISHPAGLCGTARDRKRTRTLVLPLPELRPPQRGR